MQVTAMVNICELGFNFSCRSLIQTESELGSGMYPNDGSSKPHPTTYYIPWNPWYYWRKYSSPVQRFCKYLVSHQPRVVNLLQLKPNQNLTCQNPIEIIMQFSIPASKYHTCAATTLLLKCLFLVFESPVRSGYWALEGSNRDRDQLPLVARPRIT